MPLWLSIAFDLVCEGFDAFLNGKFNAWRAGRKAQKVADAPETKKELDETLRDGGL